MCYYIIGYCSSSCHRTKDFYGTFLQLVMGGKKCLEIFSPQLLYGMKDTVFPLHVEDAKFYSINYCHYGGIKWWLM